jgi:hypothetical protein
VRNSGRERSISAGVKAIIFVAALAACTKPNPEACCDTADQCTMFGISGAPRPCGDGLVCDMTGTCIASECDTSVDCTSPDTPICIDHFCVAKCVVDADCTGVAGKPVCETDGTCGECKDDTQCTDASKSVCDMTVHDCRGCIADNECASGVCIEADGRCADASEVLYLSQDSGSDAGECTEQAPCASFNFVLPKVSPSRDVIRLVGGMFDLGSGLNLNGTSFTLDSNGTILTSSSATFSVTVQLGATITFEGVAWQTTAAKGLTVLSGASARVFDCTSTFAKTPWDSNGGHLEVRHSSVTGSGAGGTGLTCEAGTLLVDSSHLELATINTSNCDLTVRRTEMDASGGHVIAASKGVIAIENNLITASSELSDAVAITSGNAGSHYSFNTMFDTSGVVSSGQPLLCDATIDVSSNIIAWGTTVAPTCLTTYTLFDSHVSQSGTGNSSQDSSTFFVNSGAGDFHLSPTSPARMAGDTASTITDDFDGAPRPNPTGTPPDVGCYEAP